MFLVRIERVLKRDEDQIIPMAHGHCACAIVQQLLLDPAETIAATMWLTGFFRK